MGSIEQTYQKKTQLEHILLRPDTYVGSVEPEESQMWVFSSTTQSFVRRPVKIVPGLFKIFDEILVNAVRLLRTTIFLHPSQNMHTTPQFCTRLTTNKGIVKWIASR